MGPFPLLLSLCTVSAAVPSVHGTGSTFDVTEASVIVSTSRFDGVLAPAPYSIEVTADGVGLTAVGVLTPNGTLHSLTSVGGEEWRVAASGFASLADVANDTDWGFGDYAFTFFGTGGRSDTVTLAYDPGPVDPHTGFGDVLFPMNGQTGVPGTPTFTWSCSGGPCGGFAWYLEVFPIGGPGNEYDENLLNPSATSWTPGVLSSMADHGFWISSGTILTGTPQNATTDGMDSFVWAPGFETINEIQFTTSAFVPALPAWALLSLVLATALVARGRLKRHLGHVRP